MPISASVEREAKDSAMNVTLEIPDNIARRLTAGGQDIARRALEGLLIEELRAGHIDEPELAELLGVGRLELDRVLKAHGVYYDMTIEDVDRDLADLKKLGF
jgi:hypothetical protein